MGRQCLHVIEKWWWESQVDQLARCSASPPEMQLLTRCAPLLPRKHCWQVSSSSPLLSDDRPSDVQNLLPPIRELSSCLHQQGSQNRESVGDSDEVGSDFFLTVAPNFLLWPEGLRNLQLWASPCFQYLLSLSKVDIFEQGSNSFGIWGGGPGRGFFLVIFPLEMEKTKCI